MSSGRPVPALGAVEVIAARRGLVAQGHLDGLDRRGRRGRLGADGVGADRDDGRARDDLGPCEEAAGDHALGHDDGVAVGLDVDGVRDDPGAETHGHPGRDVLALGARADEDGDGGDPGRQLDHRLGLGNREVGRRLGGGHGIHPGGAVLAEGGDDGIGGRAEDDGAGLAEPAGGGEQLEGGLADTGVGGLGEDEDFAHGCWLLRPAQMNPRAARNSATWVGAVPLVDDDGAGLARRGGGDVEDLDGRGGRADLGRVDPEVGEGEGHDRLLLGGHDRLEGGVAGLAGLVGDRDDRRQAHA